MSFETQANHKFWRISWGVVRLLGPLYWQETHIIFYNKLFGPHPKPPHIGPPQKSICTSFPGKERQKGTQINFFGEIFGVKNGAPNGPLSATKSLVNCFFLALTLCSLSKMLQLRLAEQKYWGKLFCLQLELLCLQLGFLASSCLRPLLDALSHCKQKSSNCK